MTQTVASMELWLQRLLGTAPDAPKMPLQQYLDGVPQLDHLADLTRGTVVLVRGDVDAKPGPKSVEVAMVNGDYLRGELGSLDGETMKLQTRWAGTLSLPRASIAWISFLAE